MNDETFAALWRSEVPKVVAEHQRQLAEIRRMRMSGECNICGQNGCVEMAHARGAQLWRPVGGCYGKVHLVLIEGAQGCGEGKSLCGIDGRFFAAYKEPKSVTCKKCARAK